MGCPGCSAGLAGLLTLFQDERNSHVYLICRDVSVLDHDVHVLDPGALDVAQVLVARSTPWLMASSKLSSDVALNSITRATLGIDFPLLRAALLLLLRL